MPRTQGIVSHDKLETLVEQSESNIIHVTQREMAREDNLDGIDDGSDELEISPQEADRRTKNILFQLITVSDSHMKLQERNEALRIKNARLIAIISNTKNAINDKP